MNPAAIRSLAVSADELSEAAFQKRVTDLAVLRGWRFFHAMPSRVGKRVLTAAQGSPGFPDLVLARGGVVLVYELKSEKGRTRPGQVEWGEAMGGCYRLYRPSDWPAIVAELA